MPASLKALTRLYGTPLWNRLGLVVGEMLGPHEHLLLVGGCGSSEFGNLSCISNGIFQGKTVQD